MILVMNKKGGLGCTTIAFNLAKIFNLKLYTKKDSFMLSEKYRSLFLNVYKINSKASSNSIIDIGTQVETKYTKKFILKAKSIIIPTDRGFESLLLTTQTIQYIQSINKDIPILLIYNKLSRSDSDRDKNYTDYAKKLFIEFDTKSTRYEYLRFSYAFQKDLIVGNFFLNSMVDLQDLKSINYYKIFESIATNKHSNLELEFDNDYIRKERKMIKDFYIITKYIKSLPS